MGQTKTIVAFTGRARSGKNTAADIYAAMYKNDTKKQTLLTVVAGPLKDISAYALKISPQEAEGLKSFPNVKVANGLTLREFYNTLGDAIKAYFGSEVWVKLMLHRLENVTEMMDSDLVIIPDLRYPIEQEGLEKFCEEKNYNLHIVKMVNLNQTQRDDNTSIEHESESLVDQIKEDYLITANSVEEIKIQIEGVYDDTRTVWSAATGTPTDVS